jgi:archaellum biogenesis ATPase FlaH
MNGVPLDFTEDIVTPSSNQRIRSFADIPDITTLEIPPAEYLVPAMGIARNTICLWTGPDGDGKTYLAQTMALAVSRGAEFLGMACMQSPVLYVDLENPAYVVQERMQALIEDGSAPADLRFWGTWLEFDQQPPQAGSELLLTICRDSKPLLIVDPFRYFHNAEENDSTAMSGVMQYLRACAAHGAAVVILHHPSNAEGSTGRGSSAIRGACDLAFLHTLDKESGLITIKVDKNRLGPSRTITLRADFEEGKFEVSEAPYITRRNDELGRIQEIIGANPGISQNAVWKQSGGQRNRVIRLLKEGAGTHWSTEKGKFGSILYRPLAKSLYPKDGTAGTAHNEATCTAVPTPLGVVQGTGCVGPKSLPSCPRCGSFAIYDGECQTCAGRA